MNGKIGKAKRRLGHGTPNAALLSLWPRHLGRLVTESSPTQSPASPGISVIPRSAWASHSPELQSEPCLMKDVIASWPAMKYGTQWPMEVLLERWGEFYFKVGESVSGSVVSVKVLLSTMTGTRYR
jgi:hypothetical protein